MQLICGKEKGRNFIYLSFIVYSLFCSDNIGTFSHNMLVLFETPGGYALFKVLDEGKVESVENISEQFSTPEKASSL